MNLEYFKDKNLHELFETLKNKYIKTSKLTGKITILVKKEEEASKISRLIGQNIKTNIPTIVKIKTIEKSLLKTKFETVSLLEILNYLYPDLKTNKEKKEENQNAKNKLLEEFKDFYKETSIKTWFDDNLENLEFFSKTMNMLVHDKKLMYYIVLSIDEINNMDSWENLSIFATKISWNPHYFDLDSKNLTNLIWYLSIFLHMECDNTRNSKIEILNKASIYTDNYSNFVMTYNFLGDDYLNELNKREEVVILNLDNIVKLENIYAKNKKVIILENPSLLSSIVNQKEDIAFIISSGNPNISVYKLMDKLKNHKFYYNGDFDPEGLLIADKLNKMYKDLTLFGYTKEMFLKAKSNNIMSESRIKKLDKVTTLELEEVKNLIIEYKMAGYQEQIIDEINKFIRKIN